MFRLSTAALGVTMLFQQLASLQGIEFHAFTVALPTSGQSHYAYPYGARCGRLSIILASRSLLKRSFNGSHDSLRFVFIAIW